MHHTSVYVYHHQCLYVTVYRKQFLMLCCIRKAEEITERATFSEINNLAAGVCYSFLLTLNWKKKKKKKKSGIVLLLFTQLNL